MEENKQNLVKKRNYWKKEEEDLLKEWADKAQCFKWMHLKSHEIYRSKNAWFTIPVIILSTLTGTANFAQDRFPESYKSTVVMGVGALNIIAGIITTIFQFLKISELNEAHRVASLSWDKFYRNIKTELSKNPLDRFPPFEMIKVCKEEYDRLTEISPLIPKKVLENFDKTFKKNTAIIKPDVCGKLNATNIFPLTEEERQKLLDSINPVKKDITKVNQTKIIDARVEKYRNTFFQLNNRYPTEAEIQTKLKLLYDNNIEIDENIDLNSNQSENNVDVSSMGSTINDNNNDNDDDDNNDDNGDDNDNGDDGNIELKISDTNV